MKPILFKQCHFERSSDGYRSLPKQLYPHVILTGRSNVGKSTFINHFFRNRNLAKTSTKPGKTGLLNFFNVDDRIFFVDLPGFGYAKQSKKTRDTWRSMIEKYITEHQDRIFVLHFIDGRHPPTAGDWAMIEWCQEIGKKGLFVITKIDKVKKTLRKKVTDDFLVQLTPYGRVVVYDIEDPNIRGNMKIELNEALVHGQS